MSWTSACLKCSARRAHARRNTGCRLFELGECGLQRRLVVAGHRAQQRVGEFAADGCADLCDLLDRRRGGPAAPSINPGASPGSRSGGNGPVELVAVRSYDQADPVRERFWSFLDKERPVSLGEDLDRHWAGSRPACDMLDQGFSLEGAMRSSAMRRRRAGRSRAPGIRRNVISASAGSRRTRSTVDAEHFERGRVGPSGSSNSIRTGFCRPYLDLVEHGREGLAALLRREKSAEDNAGRAVSTASKRKSGAVSAIREGAQMASSLSS